ncbi:MAG TPA: hypothetical protein VKP30_27290 [Polyangiaceae bacterium]|nr:hypothetical protein [Polyangiaceae bacterium]
MCVWVGAHAGTAASMAAVGGGADAMGVVGLWAGCLQWGKYSWKSKRFNAHPGPEDSAEASANCIEAALARTAGRGFERSGAALIPTGQVTVSFLHTQS